MPGLQQAILAILSTGALIASAKPTWPACHGFFLDVPISAKAFELDAVRVDDNVDAVNFSLDIDRRTAPNITSRILGTKQITQTFKIYAELCTPHTAKRQEAIQFLTHGAVFDHRYWDSTLDPAQYSYVRAALEAGYSVFTYDRLCNGRSDKPDAYTICQGPVELEVLHVLTEMVRDGTLGRHLHAGSRLRAPIKPFPKVIHVGHSFGSQLTLGLLTSYGHLSSGVIITGVLISPTPIPLHTGDLGFQYAASNNPALFGDRGSGYLVPADTSALEYNFFYRTNDNDPSGFTDAALSYAESIKQPLTAGEWLSTQGLVDIGVSPNFTGPVLFFAGEFDELACGGDCRDFYNLATLEALYPKATAREVYLQPGAGHGLTLHRNASAGYEVISKFLGDHGL